MSNAFPTSTYLPTYLPTILAHSHLLIPPTYLPTYLLQINHLQETNHCLEETLAAKNFEISNLETALATQLVFYDDINDDANYDDRRRRQHGEGYSVGR